MYARVLRRTLRGLLMLIPATVGGCGDDEGAGAVRTATPYDAGSATVIGETKGGDFVDSTSGCATAACAAVRDSCGADGAGDVLLDEAGNVVEVICYKQAVNVDEVGIDGTGDVSAGNNTVLVLDGVDDGVDVEGDVTIEGNNSVLWGQGPDTSVISGTVNITKNSTVVRGVRIQQDVTITLNNTKLVFCVIEGNLTILGNNTTVAECDVFGDVLITGLNTTLVQNRFAGIDTVEASNLTCNGNERFDDANEDLRVDASEVSGAVACGG